AAARAASRAPAGPGRPRRGRIGRARRTGVTLGREEGPGGRGIYPYPMRSGARRAERRAAMEQGVEEGEGRRLAWRGLRPPAWAEAEAGRAFGRGLLAGLPIVAGYLPIGLA